MSPDTKLKMVTLFTMACGILAPVAVLYGVARLLKAPSWLATVAAALGFGLGFYIVFFQVFPDTFRGPMAARATIDVVVPDQHRGFVYIFFDSTQAPLSPSSANVYTLLVPPSGKLRAGQYPGQQVGENSTAYSIRYLTTGPAPLAEGSLTAGSQSHNGVSVGYIRPFIGSTAEFEAVRKDRVAKGTFFDEPQVLEQMLTQAKHPAAKPTPASLEGIDRVPGG